MLGLGNDLRRDDAAGLVVARRLRAEAEPDGIAVGEGLGEASALLDAWSGRRAVILVDAMRSGAAPGTLRRLDASRSPLTGLPSGAFSTHGSRSTARSSSGARSAACPSG